jgi:hypothetical protein
MGQNIIKGATKGIECQILSWKTKDFFFSLGNHGNHGTLFLFKRHECQKTQIKNPFDPILSFGLVLLMKYYMVMCPFFLKKMNKFTSL